MTGSDKGSARLRFFVLAVSVLLLAGAAVQHQIHFWNWYIEDAAISFAFARNWADGHGLVATPNTERLEGYSNFTWVSLLAAGHVLGFDSFSSSKWMQVVLGFFTVPITALIAREASDRDDLTPVIAAAYLASASSFAVWGACGLENSLFSFLMAAALLRSAVELRTEARWPLSAVLWCLLAMSRPEAILYCAVAGFLMMAFTLRRGVGPTLKWLVLFFVPFGAYHAVRFTYFAYEFPQTYYGKMTTKEPTPLAWNRRGWKQVRAWSQTLWTGYYLPIWFFGLVGWRGTRGALTAALLGITGFWLLAPEIAVFEPMVVGEYEIAPLVLPQDFPEQWTEGRSWMMVFAATFLPVLALGRGRDWTVWAVAIGLWGIAPIALVHGFVGVQEVGAWAVFGVLPALVLASWRLGLLRQVDHATQVRVLCWGVAAGVFFFAIYTQGDWMKAWRWMSLLQVPLAVAFATGVSQAADAVESFMARFTTAPRLSAVAAWSALLLLTVSLTLWEGARFAYGQGVAVGIGVGALLVALPVGWFRERLGLAWGPAGTAVALLLTVLPVFPNLDFTDSLNQRPETGPFSVKKRVDFVSTLRARLELEHRIVDLDVDQGAHLWWGSDTFQMMDLAGLVDIPLAQHRFKRPFVKEYIFEEMRPHYIHLHGGWASNSRIKTLPQWRRQYVEIPGFPQGGKHLHIGNYLRRDLFLRPSYDRDFEPIELSEDVVFHGFHLPSEPGAKRTLWLEVAVQDKRKRADGTVLNLVVLAKQGDEVKQVWSAPMGYGWVMSKDWRADEVFIGNFHLQTRNLDAGTYDLGFVLFDDEGPLGAAEEEETALYYAPGERWYEGALTVVSPDEEKELATLDKDGALLSAEAGNCEQAEERWKDARRHVPINKTFRKQHQPEIHRRIARCWAERDGLEALKQARLWDASDSVYLEKRGPVADALVQQGRDARHGQDWEAAYRAFSDALAVDPTRSWARRWAEEARSERLDLPSAHKKGK